MIIFPLIRFYMISYFQDAPCACLRVSGPQVWNQCYRVFFWCNDVSPSVSLCLRPLRERLHQSMWEAAHWSAVIPSVLWHQARAEALHRVYGCCGKTLLLLRRSDIILIANLLSQILCLLSPCISVSVSLIGFVSLWVLMRLVWIGPRRARSRRGESALGPLPALGTSIGWWVGWA